MKNKKAPVFGETKGLDKNFDQVDSKVIFVSSQENLKANLLAVIKPAKVIRLYNCFACEKNFTARKMSNALVICKSCYSSATAVNKGKVARNNFVEKAINNFQKFLRRRVV